MIGNFHNGVSFFGRREQFLINWAENFLPFPPYCRPSKVTEVFNREKTYFDNFSVTKLLECSLTKTISVTTCIHLFLRFHYKLKINFFFKIFFVIFVKFSASSLLQYNLNICEFTEIIFRFKQTYVNTTKFVLTD